MQCTNPFQINYENNHRITVPCMYCLSCRINRTQTWGFRILCEMPEHDGHNLFLTMTYENENLPVLSYEGDFIETVRCKDLKKMSGNEIVTLWKDDLVNFHKRLRKKELKFKYYSVGEYGEQTNRPHYHGIYLGLKYEEALQIQQTWGLGICYFGSVTTASIRYVAGYIMDKKAPEEYGIREQPFSLSSQHFGEAYFKYGLTFPDIQKCINDGYLLDNYGNRVKIPKYIKDKYTELNKGILHKRLKLIKERDYQTAEQIINDQIISMQHKEEIKKRLQSRKNRISRQNPSYNL